MRRIFILVITILSLNYSVFSQSNNTDCANSFVIPDPIEWCSEPDGFDNSNAGPSNYSASGCFEGEQNDLWFEFTAFAQAVNIVVNGDLSGIGSLNNPQVSLYRGICGGEIQQLECGNANSGPDIVNIFQGGLTIGETYLIRVGGQDDNTGTFQLCINNYNPPVEPGQDAVTASKICDKSSFVVQVLSGGGADPHEAEGTCLDISGNSENQSSWITWVAATDGTFTFTITPLNPNDDLDFVVYEFPNGIDDPTGKIALRCMAASCPGQTGLNESSTDTEEDLSCDPGEDNFVAALDMEAGKAYGLLINNFSESGVGFDIAFGGTGELFGPNPDFEISIDPDELTCDQVFEVVDVSESGTSSIVNYTWNFGEGSIPSTASGPGPHSIFYESYGEKFIALTVTSELGCIVTEVEQFNVQACCEEPSDLEIVVNDQGGIVCAGDDDGFISVSAAQGDPEYLFSFNGGPYSPVSLFEGLGVGDYEIGVIDLKGCETTRIVTIDNADPIEVDAGEDQSVEYLGLEAQLNGSFSAMGNVSFTWSPTTGVTCEDGTLNCLNPIVVAPGTTTYVVIMTDENGCTTMDSVTVNVENERPIYAPNVFSPNLDGINDVFTLIGNQLAVVGIQELIIYDRWGNKVYEGFDLPAANATQGWDGRINGQLAEPGVYSWIAKVLFIDNLDGESEYMSGDVTLLR